MLPRLLVVGCGSIGSRHARNFRSLGVDELLVVDPQASRRDALAQELDARAFETAEAAYAAHPTAVVVCSPTSGHLAPALEAVHHGCHVFVEKPVSNTLVGVDELVDAGADMVMVGYNLHFNRTAVQIKEWLDKGRIGRPSTARLHFGSYLPARHPWEDYREGYGARSALGGGVILDASHELEAALWYLGEPERVHCVAGTFGDLAIDVEDTAEILLEYDRACAAIHLDFLEAPPRRLHELVGTRGKIVADLIEGRCVLHSTAGGETEEFVDESDGNDQYLREAAHFLEFVAGRAAPPVDAAGGRKALALAAAAKESAAAGTSVSFAPEVEAASS